MHDIYIFDFDYTLYKTYEEIILWSPRGEHIINNKTCRLVGSDELPNLILAKDEYLDDDSFINFYDLNIDTAKPIIPVIEKFNCCKQKIILSARPKNSKLESKIKKLLGDVEYIGLKSSNPIDKLKIIKKYKNPCVYEDSNKLINLLIKEKIDCVKVETNNINTTLIFNYN